MTEKQPKALQLADEVDEVAQTYPDMAEVSAELRRLYQAHSRQARRLQQKEQQIQDLKRSRDFHRKETSNRLHTENQELNHKLADCASTVEHLIRCSHEDGAEILRLREENERLETLSRTLMYTLCVVNEGETK
jgi:chromosome segregation ATPase